ncbi:MAG: hypothetical protein MJZ34_05265 [Paludibacteraceae bacterium]|nr:hypothetical protein [Paludibacteraceae bacterium]
MYTIGYFKKAIDKYKDTYFKNDEESYSYTDCLESVLIYKTDDSNSIVYGIIGSFCFDNGIITLEIYGLQYFNKEIIELDDDILKYSPEDIYLRHTKLCMSHMAIKRMIDFRINSFNYGLFKDCAFKLYEDYFILNQNNEGIYDEGSCSCHINQMYSCNEKTITIHYEFCINDSNEFLIDVCIDDDYKTLRIINDEDIENFNRMVRSW